MILSKHAQYQVKNKASHPTLLHLPRHHLPFPPATPVANRFIISPIFRFTGPSTWPLSARSMDGCGSSLGFGKKSLLRQSQKGNVKCTSTVRVPTLAYQSNHTSLNAWGFYRCPFHHRVHISRCSEPAFSYLSRDRMAKVLLLTPSYWTM